MRRNVELFINNQRVDLFDFEDINIVDSIQDVRDISKIFVPYSREFTIPASKDNNKIFRHYYNNEITNGFDARFKISATIKVNGMVYKRGRVTLLNSSLKNNKAVNYKLMFYSKTIDFKTLLKDDLLKNLGGASDSLLTKYSLEYNAQNVFFGMQYGYNLTDGELQHLTPSPVDDVRSPKDLIVPFISSNNHYFFDTDVPAISPLEGDTESRNINRLETNEIKGINWKDLRLSLRIPVIVQAIEEKYGITFAGDFFEDNNEEFNRLYLWLNGDKGLYGEERTVTTDLDDFTLRLGSNDYRPITASIGDSPRRLEFKVSVDDVNEKYNLKIINKADNKTILSTTGTGTNTFLIGLDWYGDPLRDPRPIEYDLSFEVSGVESETLDFEAKLYTLRFAGTSGISYYDYDASTSSVFNISDNMPKIKVIDFLTGLFKMFNLTAYVDDDDNIVVDTLDSYYLKGNTIDVTRYVKNEDSTVSRNKLFSQIDLMFEEPKTFATINSNEFSSDEFGNERIDNTNDDVILNAILAFDGGTYEVAPKFEKMQYERMTDQSNPDYTTPIGWGWCVTDEQKATLTNPIIHYAENIDLRDNAYEIGFDPATEQEDLALSYYYRPSNSISTTSVVRQSLNFGSENGFYQTENQSLFEVYWKNTILAIYDEKSRITTYKANLPVSIANTIKLNDVVIINRKKYRINKIDINITTGDASLELVTYREIIPYAGFTVDNDGFTVDSDLITIDKTT